MGDWIADCYRAGCAARKGNKVKDSERYIHLGMKLVQTRIAGGCKIYDLMYEKKER